MDRRPRLWPGEHVRLRSGADLYVRHAEPDQPDLPAAVLVHGLGGSSVNWTGLMAELRDDLDQWAPDLPGFGDSPPARRHTIESYAAVVTEYLKGFGRPVHAVANSMGGLVMVTVAARRPDLAATLTLISPAMPHLRLPPAARGMAVLALPRVGERLLARINGVPADQQVRRLAEVLYGDPGAIDPDGFALAVEERRHRLGQGYADAVLLESLRSIVRCYAVPPWLAGRLPGRLPRRSSAWSAARLVSCPTLVILGGRDVLVGSSTAGRWRRALPGARVVMLPSTGHVAMMERPGLVAALIREHLSP